MIPRSFALVSALALSAAVASTAAAQARPQLSVGGGVTLPTGDLGDGTDAGWHGQVSLGYRPPLYPVGFRIDGAYHDLGASGGGADFRAISVTGNVVAEAPGLVVRPYLIGGVGLYNTKVSGLDGRNSVGVNGGLGLRFRLMEFDAFVEGRYHAALDAIGSGDDERAAQYVPITFGVSF